MMIRLLILFWGTLLALPAFSIEITGKAVHHLSGDTIANADVFLNSENSTGSSPVTRTNAEGVFTINTDTPFELRVVHKDYEEFVMVALSQPGQPWVCELIGKDDIQLTVEEKDLLKSHRSANGDALFIFPYRLGLADEEQAAFNDLIAFNLDMAINTHLQTISSHEIYVELLPDDLENRGNRIELYGKELNALALISGIGRNQTNGDLSVRSKFRIVPGKSGVIYVLDQFPQVLVAQAALSEKMNQLWGNSTFLSIAIRQVEQAGTGSTIDINQLQQAKTSLLDFKRDLPSGSHYLVNKIDVLLRQINRRLES
jgi:hypothetical protein